MILILSICALFLITAGFLGLYKLLKLSILEGIGSTCGVTASIACLPLLIAFIMFRSAASSSLAGFYSVKQHVSIIKYVELSQAQRLALIQQINYANSNLAQYKYYDTDPWTNWFVPNVSKIKYIKYPE